MDLFLLRQIDGIADFDEVVEFVLLAEDEDHARLLASEAGHGDEGAACWLSESTSTCEKLTRKGPARIIVRHFKAG